MTDGIQGLVALGSGWAQGPGLAQSLGWGPICLRLAEAKDAPMTDVEALLRAADRLAFGLEGGKVDLPGAVAMLQEAASMGSGEAHQRLGEMAMAGEGCAQDVEVAVKHYEQAVALGEQESMSSVALALMEAGRFDEAKPWWDRYFAWLLAPGKVVDEKPLAIVLSCYLQLAMDAKQALVHAEVFRAHQATLRGYYAQTKERLAKVGRAPGANLDAKMAYLDAQLGPGA